MHRLGRNEETNASGCTNGSRDVNNSAHLLLDALEVHGEERTRCLGVITRLLTSSLGASMPMSIANVKRNLLAGYKAFLLGSSSGSNEVLEIEIKVQHLENLITRLEEIVLKRQTNMGSSNVDSSSALSMLIVFSRLIGTSSTGQARSSKVNNNQIFKSKTEQTTMKSIAFSKMQAPQRTTPASPAEEYTRLVRECIYALQGIDGSRIRFRELQNDAGTVSCDFDGALAVCPRLVRDITYSGTITSASSYTNQLDLLRQEPFVTLDAIQLCGECGWLFLCIQQFIHQNIASSCEGEASYGRMVARALAEALRDELTDYHSFVASILEQQQQIEPEYLFTLNQLVCTVRNAKMKLHALALLVEDCNKKKKYPAHHIPSVVHIHTNLRKASSSISSRRTAASSWDSLNNSVELSKLFSKLAYRTSLPLYHKMFQWVFFGILAQNQRVSASTTSRGPDTELDFFITENISVEDAYLWWENSGEVTSSYTKTREIIHSELRSQLVTPRYSLDQSMIPVFIPHEIAQTMLNIGKGVNFVRKCLSDKSWDLMQQLVSNNNLGDIKNHTANKESLGFCYGAGDILQMTLSRCQRIVHSHILTMLFDRHSLQQHLLLMKKCLLLSQGDFVQTLIEGLDDAFTKHLSSTLITADSGIDMIDGGGVALTLPPRYTLQMLVDNALHNTNYFKLLPESFLSRILVVITSGATSISSSDTLDEDREKKSLFKWDVFSLEYSIDAPLTSVIHPVAQTRYHLMFRLIWRCKHIEYMLSKNWRSAVTVHRAVLRICKEEPAREQGVLADGSSSRALLRRTAMTRHKAMHFFSNFLSYISYEVIENSWKELDFNLGNAKTLDDIVRSHDLYMKNIVTKSMLLAKNDDHTFEHSFLDSATTSNGSEVRASSLAMHLTSVLHAAARFTAAEERVFANALNALERAAQMRRVAENRLKDKKWGFEKTPSNAMETAFSDENDSALSVLISTAEELDLELRKFITNLFRQTDDRGDSNENDDYSHTLTEVSPDLEVTPTPPGLRQHHFVETDDQGLKDSLQFLAFRLDFNRYYDKECRT